MSDILIRKEHIFFLILDRSTKRKTYPCCFFHIRCVVSLDIMMRADNILQLVVDNHTWTLKTELKFHLCSNSDDVFLLKLLLFTSCSKSLHDISRDIPKRSEKKKQQQKNKKTLNLLAISKLREKLLFRIFGAWIYAEL